MAGSPPPFDSLDSLRTRLQRLPTGSGKAADAAAAREPNLTKPPGALGRLEGLAEWLARWQGRHPPAMDRPAVAVFAGRHGVAARGVSAFPAEVTDQMVANFRAGGAAINQLSALFGATLQVVDLEADRTTADFCDGPAMTVAEMLAAMAAGAAAVDGDADALCVGEMGIGNTTSGAALAHALYGGAAADWTGPGTGVSGDALDRKAAVVGDAVARHRAETDDPLELLARLGGFELAGIAGAIVAARLAGVPVVLDGYTCCAAAAALLNAHPQALDHCVVGHLSAEPGHVRLLDAMGMAPLLRLDMRLGEASGAALALGVLKGAVACHAGMATFGEAGVSR